MTTDTDASGSPVLPARHLQHYAAEVARRAREVLVDDLVGVWLLGSAALEDYDPRRSDVDIQAVTRGPMPRATRAELARRLGHEELPNPARGLEFVLYDRAGLTAPGGPRFQLNLNSGSRMDFHLAFEPGEDPGFWFTIDVSIGRQAAVALTGPPATAVFPELPAGLVAGAVLEALDFYAGAPGGRDQALLSACRAWAWATDGAWRSKGAAARWAMCQPVDARPVERVLRRRDGEPVAPPGDEDVDRFMAAARDALTALVAPTGEPPGPRTGTTGEHPRTGGGAVDGARRTR